MTKIKKLSVVTLCFLVLFSSFPLFVSKVNSQTIQFSPIQQIINDAPEGTAVRIPSGVYYGVFKVNKSLTLVGENVILDANGSQVGIIVSASNVRLEGFEIQNAVRFGNGSIPEEISELWLNPEMEGAGIYIYWADNVVISNIVIRDCYAGMGFTHSFNARVSTTINRTLWGVLLYCSHIEIFNSKIINALREYTAPDGRTQTGGGGINIHHYSQINMTYSTLLNTSWAISVSPWAHYSYINRNNFINNTRQVDIHPDTDREVANWNNNFWSDYNGTDLDIDGIGDIPYMIDYNNLDGAPLMIDPTLPQSQIRKHGICHVQVLLEHS